MATKRTYSVRLEDAQREHLEKRAAYLGLPTGHLIRSAIDDFLRQQEEKDYLGEVQAAIITSIAKLARQVEKDRAEQQLMVGLLDHLCDWLGFVLPSPPDKAAAEELRQKRRESFYESALDKFSSQSRARFTDYVDSKKTTSHPCTACGKGYLRCKASKSGTLFWYCSNWNSSSSKCTVTFADDMGRPAITQSSTL